MNEEELEIFKNALLMYPEYLFTNTLAYMLSDFNMHPSLKILFEFCLQGIVKKLKIPTSQINTFKTPVPICPDVIQKIIDGESNISDLENEFQYPCTVLLYCFSNSNYSRSQIADLIGYLNQTPE